MNNIVHVAILAAGVVTLAGCGTTAAIQAHSNHPTVRATADRAASKLSNKAFSITLDLSAVKETSHGALTNAAVTAPRFVVVNERVACWGSAMVWEPSK